MKIDIAKLPVAEAVVGFFIVVIILTFIGAFSATGSGADEAVSGSPTPRETPRTAARRRRTVTAEDRSPSP